MKNRIIRYDFGARRMKKQNEIVDALLGEECNYENNEHSEIELAVDETGLWVRENFINHRVQYDIRSTMDIRCNHISHYL